MYYKTSKEGNVISLFCMRAAPGSKKTIFCSDICLRNLVNIVLMLLHRHRLCLSYKV